MQVRIGEVTVFKTVKGIAVIEKGVTTYLSSAELHDKLFCVWMEKNYPKLRIDSVTAQLYKEVFIGACLINDEWHD